MTDALAHLIEQGVLGIICAMLVIVCIRLFNDNQKLHKERLEDAKVFADTIVKQNTEIVRALTLNTDALQAQKESTIETRQAFRELCEELRNRFRGR